MQENLSVKDATNVHVSENRHTINESVADISTLESQMLNISQRLENKLTDLEQLLQVYLQLDLAAEEIKRMRRKIQISLEHFQLQLNMKVVTKSDYS